MWPKRFLKKYVNGKVRNNLSCIATLHTQSIVRKYSGGMAEWFKAAVLKTAVLRNWDRGFESYSLRHHTNRKRSIEVDKPKMIY